MVNIPMQNQPEKTESTWDQTADDTGIVHVQAFLKIMDADSGEILLETRA